MMSRDRHLRSREGLSKDGVRSRETDRDLFSREAARSPAAYSGIYEEGESVSLSRDALFSRDRSVTSDGTEGGGRSRLGARSREERKKLMEEAHPEGVIALLLRMTLTPDSMRRPPADWIAQFLRRGLERLEAGN